MILFQHSLGMKWRTARNKNVFYTIFWGLEFKKKETWVATNNICIVRLQKKIIVITTCWDSAVFCHGLQIELMPRAGLNLFSSAKEHNFTVNHFVNISGPYSPIYSQKSLYEAIDNTYDETRSKLATSSLAVYSSYTRCYAFRHLQSLLLFSCWYLYISLKISLYHYGNITTSKHHITHAAYFNLQGWDKKHSKLLSEMHRRIPRQLLYCIPTTS